MPGPAAIDRSPVAFHQRPAAPRDRSADTGFRAGPASSKSWRGRVRARGPSVTTGDGPNASGSSPRGGEDPGRADWLFKTGHPVRIGHRTPGHGASVLPGGGGTCEFWRVTPRIMRPAGGEYPRGSDGSKVRPGDKYPSDERRDPAFAQAPRWAGRDRRSSFHAAGLGRRPPGSPGCDQGSRDRTDRVPAVGLPCEAVGAGRGPSPALPCLCSALGLLLAAGAAPSSPPPGRADLALPEWRIDFHKVDPGSAGAAPGGYTLHGDGETRRGTLKADAAGFIDLPEVALGARLEPRLLELLDRLGAAVLPARRRHSQGS